MTKEPDGAQANGEAVSGRKSDVDHETESSLAAKAKKVVERLRPILEELADDAPQ